MAGILVIFDFDNTIIDCDSDNWVVDELGFNQLYNELLPTMPWNSLMVYFNSLCVSSLLASFCFSVSILYTQGRINGVVKELDRLMQELHSHGITIKQIEDCLKRAPLHPRIIAAIKSAHSFGCELRIVSDANPFFIETILKHHGLIDYFSEIITNPSFINEEGRLRICPYHDFTSSPHGCNLCPPNLCKGLVIEIIQASEFAEGEKRFIYLGDGKGDYCPSLKFGEGDRVMPRKHFPLWDLMCNNPLLWKAEVHEWSSGEELERVLLDLINMITIEEGSNTNSAQLISGDCKFQTIPVSSHESLSQSSLSRVTT
ncbi:hypothetical protein NE237_021891 [Protea cynaroides]|uniref:Uncharacterized protein n=1 Tax=Protea cynaroides TaxID=273540 RepID=A0A9Q0K3P7_9MAGN|nr:hypothetical protein NE237_021891 [Protea cynaroides]